MIKMFTFGGRTQAKNNIFRWVEGPVLTDVVNVTYQLGEVNLAFDSKDTCENARTKTGWPLVQPVCEGENSQLAVPFSASKDSFEMMKGKKKECFSEFHFESVGQPMRLHLMMDEVYKKLYPFANNDLFIEDIEFFNYWHGNFMLSFKDQDAAIKAQELTGWASNFLLLNALDFRFDESRCIVISSGHFSITIQHFELTIS